ncbi:AAA family ATPase [Microbacter sp. GSS18]|nr:AAA family ATPase [Microbacter sp. GSS18]
MPLLERDEQLAALDSLADGLPSGSIALVGAEAGAGKTSLLRAFAARAPAGMPVRSGRCDDLATPASFAPLWDMADTLPDPVTAALDGDGPRVPAALAAALREQPSVLILDDVQWADEATIDLIGHLGRRIDDLPLLLCLAYRSDEIDRDHPLRRVLGELSRSAIRVDLPVLTMQGVGRLAEGTGVDVAQLYAHSRGNPFFVTELLASPALEPTRAVSDAVMARVASLPASAWTVLDVVALAPQGVPTDLLAALGRDAEADADRALERGLLEVSGTRLRCRHDLVRTALANGIPPLRRRRVHQLLVDRLASRATTTADIAQVAAHAIGAGDDRRAAEYSLRAARRAAADGAHRQAARHFAHALERRAHLRPDEVEHALDACANEAYFAHDLDLAIACALELRERARDLPPAEQGRRTAWLSRLAHYAGESDRAAALAQEGIDLLAGGSDPLQESYLRWWRALLVGDDASARRLGTRTVALAHEAGNLAIAAHVLVSAYGTDDRWVERLEQGLEVARRAGSDEQTARAYCNLVYQSVVERRLDEADRWLDEGLEWTWGEDMTFWWDAMVDSRALQRLYRGEWDAALEDCDRTIDGQRALRWQSCAAHTRATILLRRGAPGAAAARAFAAACAAESSHDALLATSLEAETAWTAGADPATAVDGIALATTAGDRPSPWLVGGAVFWLAKIDPGLVPPEVRSSVPEPVIRELDGDRAGAAEMWRRRGCVFEAAVLDGLGDDPDVMRRAFTELTALGAEATMARLRLEARARGVRAVPRGARVSTASDPDGLTPRQVEVLRLLGARLTDAEIAARLHLSDKTVGHHVSAILARLGVDGRREAGAHARTRFPSDPGVTGDPMRG